MTNIKLHIEELVLHGFSPHDRYAIAEAVERELSQLFAADYGASRLSHSLPDHSNVPRLDAGNFQVAPGATGGSIGARIAQAIHGGIAK